MDWSHLDIARIKDGRSLRTSSYDTSGGNDDFWTLPAGEKATLLDVAGPGVVQHIWITMASKGDFHRKDVLIRAYWDGSDRPSVEAPIGDFFGQGWGETYLFSSPWLAAAPRGGKALVCYFPMPYRSGAKIELANQGDADVERLYFYIDYEETAIPNNIGLFHAWYNQELTKCEVGRENEWATFGPYEKNANNEGNYLWVATEGRGHFAGVNYYINNPTPMWYGEGDDMFLIDGEPWPGLHGTGTEDYFNTAWSPDECFRHPNFGIAYAPSVGNDDPRWGWLGKHHVYRFHPSDPVRFQSSLHASIEHGHANCLNLDLSSVAYWYQDQPSQVLPEMPPASARRPQLRPTPNDVLRWRESFRKDLGLDHVWGTERRNPDNDPIL